MKKALTIISFTLIVAVFVAITVLGFVRFENMLDKLASLRYSFRRGPIVEIID